MPTDAESLQRTLGERYVLGPEVGRGGMATVYRAIDQKLQRAVAVKVFDDSLGSVVSVRRFQSEIAIAATLQHPSIVPLYDSGGAGDQLFYIMPLIEGETLRDRLKREGQLPVSVAVQILREVAGAIDYAHTHGVVHRDIKPENILLSSGRAVVADFGIARAITQAGGERLTSSALAVGTPVYMSPEQSDSSAPIDGRADVYSLACVFYEMLAGEPPFTGRTAQAILARHLHDRPPSLQVVRPTVPASMQFAVERALAKVPADRYATASEFADAVAASFTGGVVDEPRPRPSRTLVAMAIAAVLAVVAWGVFGGGYPEPDPSRVVVYPFTTVGGADDDAAGEQVALLIGSALEHTEPLRWLDGQRLLWNLAGTDFRRLGARAAKTARRAGARYYIDGSIVAARDSLTVIVRLHDALPDTLVHQQSASGRVDDASAPQLALRAIAVTLARLLPTTARIDLAYIADRAPAAIANWLQGEREYARAQYAAALRHMQMALESDSSTGVAALKGALAARAMDDYVTAKQLSDLTLRLLPQLPVRYALLARGLQHFASGNADSARLLFVAAHKADTTWAEPWALLGETYWHLMPTTRAADSIAVFRRHDTLSVYGDLDSLAEEAFSAAVRRDERFAPALLHLGEISAIRGQPREARKIVEVVRSLRPDSAWMLQLELVVRCAAEGPADIDWASAVTIAFDRVVNVARVLGAGARFPECSRRAQEAALAYDTDTTVAHKTNRWSALKGLDFQATAEGKHDRAFQLLDSGRVHGQPAAVSLHLFNVVAGSSLAHPHAAAAMATIDRPVHQMSAITLRYFALWEFANGNVVRLDSIARRIRVVADSTQLGSDLMMADATAARLALLTADTTRAIELLENLRITGSMGLIAWNLWEAAVAERLLLAELLVARGRGREAIAVASTFDSPRSQLHLLFLPASLRVRVRATEALGATAERRRYESRLNRLNSAGPS